MTSDFARTAGAGLRLVRSVLFGSSLVLTGLNPALATVQAEAPLNLVSAATYAVLADGAVTNNGASVLDGDVGVHPGTQVTGFPPGVVNGQRHLGDVEAERAQADLATAYDDAQRRTPTRTVGADLGGQTFTPGVYRLPPDASLDGTVTLDAQGDTRAVFIFQLESGLSTTDNSRVEVRNAPGPACNISWIVGDSATLAPGTALVGRLMAVNAITLRSGARIEQGGAFSRDGAITLDNNVIRRSECEPTAAPAQPSVTPTSPSPSPTSASPTPSPTSPSPTPSPTSPTPTPTTATPGTATPGAGTPGAGTPIGPSAPTSPQTSAPATPEPAPGTTGPGAPGVTVPPTAPGVPGTQPS